MIVTGVFMILYFPIVHHKLNIVLAVFGAVGLWNAVNDLVLHANPEKLRKNWLKLHLGKMIGGYIAASTAFVAVNSFFQVFTVGLFPV